MIFGSNNERTPSSDDKHNIFFLSKGNDNGINRQNDCWLK